MTVVPGADYFTCDGYNANHSAPKGTIYRFRHGNTTFKVRAEQKIFAGAWFYPGDPKRFGQLAEMPLFWQMGQ